MASADDEPFDAGNMAGTASASYVDVHIYLLKLCK